MHHSILLLFALSLVSAGCDELSSYDDPRDSPSTAENGSCNGVALECNQLTETACAAAGGCSWRQACFSSERNVCFGRTREASCQDGFEPFCQWEDAQATCFAPRSTLCDLEETRAECDSSPFTECRWGLTCEGDARRCFGISDIQACLAQPGCEWF